MCFEKPAAWAHMTRGNNTGEGSSLTNVSRVVNAQPDSKDEVEAGDHLNGQAPKVHASSNIHLPHIPKIQQFDLYLCAQTIPKAQGRQNVRECRERKIGPECRWRYEQWDTVWRWVWREMRAPGFAPAPRQWTRPSPIRRSTSSTWMHPQTRNSSPLASLSRASSAPSALMSLDSSGKHQSLRPAKSFCHLSAILLSLFSHGRPLSLLQQVHMWQWNKGKLTHWWSDMPHETFGNRFVLGMWTSLNNSSQRDFL